MAQKAPRVEWGKNYDTAQIYSKGFEFAFMSRRPRARIFRQATTFVYCKDFLHDALWGFLHGKSVSIYDFKYNPKKDEPLNLDRTALAFRNTAYKGKATDFHDKRAACLEFLQAVDQKLGFRPSQVHRIPHDGGPCWLILGDKRWQHSPTMLSFYSLLIRVGFFHQEGDKPEETISRAEKGKIKISSSGYAGNKDCSYVKQARKGIDLILKHGISIFHKSQRDNFPRSVDTYELHDNFGIVHFTRREPAEYMPHWYRKEIWGSK